MASKLTKEEDSSSSSDEGFVILSATAAAPRWQSDRVTAAVGIEKSDDADHAAGDARRYKQSSSSNVNETQSSSSAASVNKSADKSSTARKPANNLPHAPPRSKKSPSSQRPSLQQHHRPRPTLQRSSSSSFNTSLRNIYKSTNQSFRTLRRQSSSIITSLNSNLPATPTGWALSALSLCSMGLQYELRLQKELTAPPIVFCQAGNGSGRSGSGVLNERMSRIYNKLTLPNDEVVASLNNKKKKKKEGIFSRTVKPSLFIGTRGVVASTAAYALGSKKHQDENKVQRVREVMKMGADGALIVLDWEIPLDDDDDDDDVAGSSNTSNSNSTTNNKIDITKPNSITKPIILLLHGMNNDSTFGYIRSMMHTATSRGWVAVCMNLRGQDGLHQVKNVTPRGYNAGYTGDLRGVVEQLEYRLMKRSSRSGSGGNDKDDEEDDYIGGPIYLLGYSLGANIVTKYLGEESLHGTLPKCIGGGAAMGNPLHIHSGTISFPWNMLLGAGVKRSILQNASTYMKHNEPGFQHAMKKALLAPTIGKLDDAAAPYLIRNNAYPPYSLRIGFKDGEEYWWESSSHRYVGHVSVPLLKISAQDDFLVFGQFQKKLNHCLENPNVVVVKTRCGGHLGWQESPPPSSTGEGGGGLLGGSGSWSDVAVADFIEALLQIRQEDREKRMKERRMRGGQEVQEEELVDAFTPPKLMSRL
ncbi:hypothetical protein ACHAWC_011378 [Mediolabrus comicus]